MLRQLSFSITSCFSRMPTTWTRPHFTVVRGSDFTMFVNPGVWWVRPCISALAHQGQLSIFRQLSNWQWQPLR